MPCHAMPSSIDKLPSHTVVGKNVMIHTRSVRFVFAFNGCHVMSCHVIQLQYRTGRRLIRFPHFLHNGNVSSQQLWSSESLSSSSSKKSKVTRRRRQLRRIRNHPTLSLPPMKLPSSRHNHGRCCYEENSSSIFHKKSKVAGIGVGECF